MELIVSNSETTKKYIAVGIIFILLAILGMVMFSTYILIQDRDKAVTAAHDRLINNSTDLLLMGEYNTAVREYKGATAYFPGTLIAMITPYKVDKWELVDDGTIHNTYGLFIAPPSTFSQVS